MKASCTRHVEQYKRDFDDHAEEEHQSAFSARAGDSALPHEARRVVVQATRRMGNAQRTAGYSLRYRGQLIAIEVKTGRGRLTPQQKAELDSLRAAGAVVLVGSAEEVIRELETITEEPQRRLL